MRGLWFCAILVTPAVLFARQSNDPAKDPHALVQRGIALHREAAFAASVAALEQARQSRDLETSEAAECSFYLAAGYVALNSLPAARRELKQLVELNPGYELPQYTSPKVAALFREVRDEQEKLPKLRALPPRRKAAGRVALFFEAARAGGTSFGVAMWRWRGETAYHEAALEHEDEKLVAHLELQHNGMLEYYAEARGPNGLATAASKERPLELPIAGVPEDARAGSARWGEARPALLVEGGRERPPGKTKIAKAWWLWTAVGVVAAAGVGVGLYFALRPAPTGTADAVLDFQVH